MASIVVIGPGRAGVSLAGALAASGRWREICLSGRHPREPDHPAAAAPGIRYVYGLEPLADDTRSVLLAVPDDELPDVVHSLAALGPAPEGCTAFHLSGSLPTDVLEPLHHAGYGVGSFLPLVSLTDPARGASRMAGARVAVTAASDVVRVAADVASSMGAEVFRVPAVRRPLFHAATTLVAGSVAPVLARATGLLEEAGVSSDDALAALVALTHGVLDRIEEHGAVAGAATTEVDAETTALHLRALEPDDARDYALFLRAGLRLREREEGGAEGRDAVARLLDRVLDLETTEVGAGH